MLSGDQQTAGEMVWWGERRWARWALILGIWTLVGFIFGSQIYWGFLYTDRPLPLSGAILWQMGAAYWAAALTPLMLWLARRFRIERPRVRRNIIIHILAGLLMAALLAAGHTALDMLYWREQSGILSLAYFTRSMLFLIDRELLVYWLVVLMSHAFNYYSRYRSGELRASRLEAQLAQAQLQALKMQLHPHFLFNTLHSISALLRKDIEAADKMITHLGDFLRLTLDNSGTQKVPLRQELEFLSCYLEIERVRFQDRLTTRIEVQPDALDCEVPNLILQPIVENSIRHGIASISAPGWIEIRAERKKGALRIEVRDNGPGLSANRKNEQGVKGGLGLANTQARLDQLYNAAYRLDLSNGPEGGLIVTLELPSEVSAPPEDTEEARWGTHGCRQANPSFNY